MAAKEEKNSKLLLAVAIFLVLYIKRCQYVY